MMAGPQFHLRLTGDYSDEDGAFAGGSLGQALQEELDRLPLTYDIIRHQAPRKGDARYWDNIYSMVVEPDDIADADAVLVCRPWVKPSTFARGAARLWFILRAGVGYDKIDIDACTANDVLVCNLPDSLTRSTASAAFVLMHMVARRTPELERIVRQNRWDLQQQTVGHDLYEHTLGILGLGRTGMELARLVAPYHMRILAYSPHADPRQAAEVGARLVPDMDELLQQADFVSLHGRLTPQTRHMLGERELRLMKPSAYLINVARGEMIDQQALYRVLKERAIAGAGLDVFEHEPLPMDDPLLTLDNVVLTPHWLVSTYEQAEVARRDIVVALGAAVRGQVPPNVLNPAVLERPGFQAKRARHSR